MSTQVNFEIRIPNTGSLPAEDLEKVMLQLRDRLKVETVLFLAKTVAVPPEVLMRGPTIMHLKD